MTEIRCPADCGYLSLSREHPPAIAVRQHQHDVALLYRGLRDFGERQSQLFLLVATFLRHYQPDDLHQVVDEDVREAATALASTLETSSRGLIYEHRPASLPALRLLDALKPLVAKAGGSGGTPFERDAASVLRRVAETVGDVAAADGGPRAFLDWVGRILRESEAPPDMPRGGDAPRLIVS